MSLHLEVTEPEAPAGPITLRDRLPGLVLLAFSVVFGIAGANIQYSFSSDPLGPRAFPVALSLILGGLSVWYMLSPGRSESWPRGVLLRKVLALIALSILTALFYQPLGFPISTFIQCVGTALLFQATLRQAAMVGIGNAALWYLLFTKVFEIALPLGTVFGG